MISMLRLTLHAMAQPIAVAAPGEKPASDGKTRHSRSARRSTPPRAGRESLSSGILDAIGLAIILVTAERRILQLNRIATKALSRGDGLVARKTFLTCAQDNFQARLVRAVASAAKSRTPGAMMLERHGGQPPYQLTIAAAPGGAALVLFRDPDSEDASLGTRLRALFALTAAEAGLAVALSHGASLAEIAAARRVRESTVRSQMKSIAAKMHCRRQAEISAIVARLPPLHL